MQTQLEKTIHNTLAYFAYFQYPLTVFEIYKWQYRPDRVYKYFEIKEALDDSDWLSKRVGSFEGMYALGSNGEVEQQVSSRRRRFLDSVRKQRKAGKAVRYLSRIPCVKGVAICNSLAFHFTREKSDIDFFVITDHNRIWSSRFWSIFPLMLFRQRPGETKKDPIDISFFLSTEDMNIEHLKMQDEDPYFAFWICNLMPVYGDEKVWNSFFEQNKWVLNYLPNAIFPKLSYGARLGRRSHLPAHIVPEGLLRPLQKINLPKQIKSKANKDTCVVVNDKVLKFHTTDRRLEIFEAFDKKRVL
jgi:hypothetical protein